MQTGNAHGLDTFRKVAIFLNSHVPRVGAFFIDGGKLENEKAGESQGEIFFAFLEKLFRGKKTQEVEWKRIKWNDVAIAPIDKKVRFGKADLAS